MKKYHILFISSFFIMTSCAIQGEVYRLQTRINYWYQLLDEKEEQLFTQNDTVALGVLLDQKEQNSEDFQKQIRDVRINEAIMSFDGTQTAHFFYNILLKDLAKFSYEEFMNTLTVQQKMVFIQQTNFSTNTFTNVQSVFQNAKKEYGFNSFTDEQILLYYRTVSFPANYYIVVYNILAFLARYRAMDVFLQGDMINTLSLFDDISQLEKSRRIPIRKQAKKDLKTWASLKQRTYLDDLSNEEFLAVVQIILPKMDDQVRMQTINNIRNRFKEE